VECYSRVGADALAAKIEAMELGSPERGRAERDLISRSVMIEVEPDGRIVLPIKVREKMGFAGDDLAGGGEASFAGFTNRFKLYRREVYEAELAEDDDDDACWIRPPRPFRATLGAHRRDRAVVDAAPLERIRDSRRSAAEDGWTRDGTAHRATTQPTDRTVP
jgi:DNA-binding transcriptional regulator/RsmH inhibitor MraZ